MDETSGAKPQKPNTDDIRCVVPNHDLVLVCKEGVKLGVFAAVLSNASKVFRAMLNSSFKEGQDTSGRRVIELPDDHASAMEKMCRCIHFTLPNEKSRWIAYIGLLDIALAADKYDCIAAVSGPLSQGIGQYLRSQNQNPELWAERIGCEMIVAAYLLRDSTLFSDFTRIVALKQPLSRGFLDTLAPHQDSTPGSLSGHLEILRNELHKESVDALRLIYADKPFESSDPRRWPSTVGAQSSYGDDKNKHYREDNTLNVCLSIANLRGSSIDDIMAGVREDVGLHLKDGYWLKTPAAAGLYVALACVIKEFDRGTKGCCLACVLKSEGKASTVDHTCGKD